MTFCINGTSDLNPAHLQINQSLRIASPFLVLFTDISLLPSQEPSHLLLTLILPQLIPEMHIPLALHTLNAGKEPLLDQRVFLAIAALDGTDVLLL